MAKRSLRNLSARTSFNSRAPRFPGSKSSPPIIWRRIAYKKIIRKRISCKLLRIDRSLRGICWRRKIGARLVSGDPRLVGGGGKAGVPRPLPLGRTRIDPTRVKNSRPNLSRSTGEGALKVRISLWTRRSGETREKFRNQIAIARLIKTNLAREFLRQASRMIDLRGRPRMTLIASSLSHKYRYSKNREIQKRSQVLAGWGSWVEIERFQIWSPKNRRRSSRRNKIRRYKISKNRTWN